MSYACPLECSLGLDLSYSRTISSAIPGSGVAFFAVGYAFAYGGTPQDTLDVYTQELVEAPVTFIGRTNFLLIGVENYSFWMYQYAFAATAATSESLFCSSVQVRIGQHQLTFFFCSSARVLALLFASLLYAGPL